MRNTASTWRIPLSDYFLRLYWDFVLLNTFLYFQISSNKHILSNLREKRLAPKRTTQTKYS